MHEPYDSYGVLRPGGEAPHAAHPDYGPDGTFPGGQEHFTAPDLAVLGGRWESEAELTELLEQSADAEHVAPFIPPPRAPRPAFSHRRHRFRRLRKVVRKPTWSVTRVQVMSYAIAAVVAIVVAMVSVLGGMFTHDPLRRAATPDTAGGLAMWWPVLIYGPWLAASLSVVRHAVHQRRAPHAWAVVLLFCAFAVLLCVARAPQTPHGMAVAALPTIAALTCFHQLVRQITLTRPLRRSTPGRRSASRR